MGVKIMKKTLIILLASVFCSTVIADRELDESEILNILTELTQSPTKSWISSGSIEATHTEYRASQITNVDEINLHITQETQAYRDNPDKIQKTEELQAMMLEAIPFNVRYKLSNEYTMTSTVTIKVDCEKFYWQINVVSRTDFVKKPEELKDNFLTDEFDLGCNTERIFAWNGQEYVTYFKPVNHAIITDTPSGVNGPLTAGVIHWGYGNYTPENLSRTDLVGLETEINGQKQIQLTVLRTDGLQGTFILNPSYDYAVEQYSAHLPNNTFVLQFYDDYRQVAGKWCPGSILIEKYDTTQNPHRLIARDIWDFTSFDDQKPSSISFEVSYEIYTYIEDFSFGIEPLRYFYSAPLPPSVKKVDTDELIWQRLVMVSATSKQNCATASLKYVCDKSGIDCPPEILSHMVYGKRSVTSLAQMKQFVEHLGLDAWAARFDIETLKSLSNYQVIIHLPDREHFVVLGDIDDKHIGLIDLSSNRLYDRYSIDSFNSIWDGMALVVSRNPVKRVGNFITLDNIQLDKIVGACPNGEQCNTSCSGSGDSPCQEIGGDCGGTHTIYYSRTCCGSATAGACLDSEMVCKKSENCGLDENLDCTGEGNWTTSKMLACN